MLSLILLAPLAQAHAGFISSLLGNLIDSSASAVQAEENPHTFPHDTSTLLAAATNSDPNPNKGEPGAGIEGDALVPFLTPDGTVFSEGLTPVGKTGPARVSRYLVHRGDTLGAIAKLYGVSVNTIRWANELKTAQSLKIGQELIILPVTGVQYTIKKGDTLATVAKKFKGDPQEIISYNSLADAGDLSVGETIIIPDGVESQALHSSRAGQSPYIPGDSGPDLVGYYLRPLPAYCPRTQGLHGHNAVDLGCPVGTEISAAAAGEVTIARDEGYNGGYGKFVVITHPNGTQTLYAHMSEVEVVPGQNVSQAQKLGEVGRTGHATGPHLHFEVRGAKNPF